MKRVISGVPFSDCEYYPCGLVALDALLGFYGYDTPLVLHDQWVLLYKRPENGGIKLSPRLDSEFQSLYQAGIEGVTHRETCGEAAWEKVKSRVDDGRPVAAMLDTFNLEMYYYPGLGHHSGHYVIVDGYDQRAQTVHVVDPSWIVRFRGDLPLAGFKDGWGSEHIPRYQWMEFQFPIPRQSVKGDKILATLRRNVMLMYLEKTTSPEMCIGLNGLKTLAEDLKGWKKERGDRVSTHLKQLYDQVRSVIIERDGHGKYLRSAAEIIELPQIASVGEELRNVTQKWIVFRNHCLRGQRKHAPAALLDKLHQRLLDIATLEENALIRLGKLV